jgi:BirA family biotin operon repressor/biotin-[acetyl-CoA-carboxylase] ligase
MTSYFFKETIEGLRTQQGCPLAIEVVKETASTNADLLARAGSLRAPLLLIAESQTAGRGRAGRAWQAARGSSLTFSLAWKFARPLHELTALPLAVGVAVCDALQDCGIKTALKWPNDILSAGAKLGGVLVETVRQGSYTLAVIGVGINLSLDENLAGRIGFPAASLEGKVDGNLAMARLADALCDALPVFEAGGFPAFTERWNRLDAYAGKPVRIVDGGTVRHEGIAAGVDDVGRLKLNTPQGAIVVMSGDVSLRGSGQDPVDPVC